MISVIQLLTLQRVAETAAKGQLQQQSWWSSVISWWRHFLMPRAPSSVVQIAQQNVDVNDFHAACTLATEAGKCEMQS